MLKNKKNFNKYHNFEFSLLNQVNENTLFKDNLAEQTVLNLMMLDSEKQQLASQYLSSEYFFFSSNRQLFEFIKEKRNKTISGMGVFHDFYEIKTFIENDESKNKYPLVTVKLINEINTLFVNEDNFLANVEHLIELNKLRNLEVFYQVSLNSLSHNKEITWTNSIQDFETFLEENFSNSLHNSSFVSFKKATDEFESLIEKGRRNEIPEGLKTGFNTLDNLLKGLKAGQLVILAARPGVGKTALALNIAKNITQEETINSNHEIIRPYSCAFISLEMPYMELTLRLYSSMSNIPLAKLQKPSLLDSTEMTSLRSTIATNKDLTNLYLDDNTSSKISDIIWKIRQLNKEIPGGLQLIVIDYLQLISGSEFSGNRQNEIAQISRSLKLLALDLKIPIIALSQLSRTVETRENKRPQLSDLRESGAIEQDADIVIFLSRNILHKKTNNENEFIENHSITEVTIAKNRNGQVGYGEMLYDGKIVTFWEETK
ncbi:DnaB-like helicase C-terminal domain-containing protein [Mycoplasmopsis cynos]|uniref:DnaB-like helicase C-terminal domain-containing protein n=1 Tax=Mycoplasmopsis cynos TaxID=171284 RepID=UPI002AFE68AA|nr:DnaB-like helicase C-terminal domain-containing protein [Mycoplasmopsis cynos]WQQ16820.1 DnaB-like helicase C-terminal domain-containing protein [Mycoplasmopsis cynos]